MRWPFGRKRKAPGDTGGREARERAEEALAEVRRRRATQEELRRWFRVDAAENHYGRDVQTIFKGGPS